MVERLRDAAGRRGLAVVVVTHDLTMAGALADRLVLLGEGGILADGAPAEVLVPERLERAFGLPVSVTQIAGRTVVVPRAPA